MDNHAYVVGLGGGQVPELLAAIKNRFGTDQYRPLTALHVVEDYLPSTTPHTSDDTVFHTTLKTEDIRDLYNSRDVRAWSSANWQDWTGQMTYSRLGGRLALYHNYQKIDNWLEKHLLTPPSSNHIFYLIASLYDAFASGALIDMAQLISKKLQARKGRLFGILMLPHTSNDQEPVSQVESEASSHARATAYAALRELQLVNSSNMFNPTHNIPTANVQLKTSYVSPFSSGACYIVDGQYQEQVASQIARFIWLQTKTPLLSRQNIGFGSFSTFGTAEYIPDEHHVSDRQNISSLELNKNNAIIKQRLKTRGAAYSEKAFYDASALPLLIATPEQFTQAQHSTSSKVVRRQLSADEDAHQKAIDKMRDTAYALNRQAEQEIQEMIQYWKHKLEGWDIRRDGSFEDLSQAVSATERQLKNQCDNVEKESTQIEAEARAAARQLVNARHQYIYINDGSTAQTAYLSSTVVVVMVAALFWTAGQALSTLLWLNVGLAVPIIAYGWMRQRQEQLVTHQLVNARQRFRDIQLEIIQRRARSAFYDRVRWAFHHMIVARVQRMNETLETLQARIDEKNGVEVHSDLLDEATTYAFRKLFELTSDKNPSQAFSTALGEYLTEKLSQRQTEWVSDGSYKKARQDAQKIPTLLGINNIIEQPSSHYIIYYADRSINDQLRGTTADVNHDNISFIDATSSLKNTANLRAGSRYYVTIRDDFKLAHMQVIDILRNSYKTQTQQKTDDNQITYFNAFYHPTRWGVASPDILPIPYEADYGGAQFVALFLVTLRLICAEKVKDSLKQQQTNISNALDRLCANLHIENTPTINYDELCGILNQDRESQGLLDEWHKSGAEHHRDNKTTDIYDLIEMAKKQAHNLVVSELYYADWEVLTAHKLAALTETRQEHTSLIHIIRGFVNHYGDSKGQTNDQSSS